LTDSLLCDRLRTERLFGLQGGLSPKPNRQPKSAIGGPISNEKIAFNAQEKLGEDEMTRLNALRCTASLVAIAMGTATAGGALAQNAATTSSTTQEVGELVVTGSRVASGADAPTPVTAVSPETINQVQQPNIADALAQLPTLRGSSTPERGGQGGTIGSSESLRSLGSTRTLTLVDGERFVPTMQFGLSTGVQAVNTESLPQGLVKRVDVVTGGASAAYGSDAVAGVVNFVLDDHFEGFKATLQGGETQRSDARNFSTDITAGSSFANGKGHLVIDAEFARDEGVPFDNTGLHSSRDWNSAANTIGSEAAPNILINGVSTQTKQLVKGATYWQYPLNGLIDGCVVGGSSKSFNACPVYATGFNAAGTATQPYNFGGIPQPNATFPGTPATSSKFDIGGDGSSPGGQTVIDTPSLRHGIYARLTYDLTPRTSVYFDVLDHDTEENTVAGAGTPQFFSNNSTTPVSNASLGFVLAQNNPYLPASLVAQMQANNISAVDVSKIVNFNVQQDFAAHTDRISTGFKTDFNDNWSATGYYTYGIIHSYMKLVNFTNDNHLYNALQAVVAPTAGATWTAGQIVCASTLTGGNDGCTPWNPLGSAPLTAAQQAYLNPIDYYYSTNDQQAAEVSIKGTPFSLPAGPLDVALGAGYREESVNRTSDSLGEAQIPNAFNPKLIGALAYLNNPAINGSIHLWETFGEAEVPILKDLPAVKSLDGNLAVRYTDYSNGGGVTTWKAGLTYEPMDGMRFRTAYSADVRAPNLVELFSPPSSGFSSVSDPLNNNVQQTFTPESVGNPNLKPEEGHTFTFGGVFQPSFLPGFYASIDYFNIRVTNEIGSLGAQTIVNQCLGANNTVQVASSCNLITRAPTTNLILSILLPEQNLASAAYNGIDWELGYNHPINFWKLHGDLTLHSYITLNLENKVISAPGASQFNTAHGPGQVVALASADYKTGPWTFGLQEHFSNGGLRSLTVSQVYAGNTVPDTVWTDLIVQRRFGKYETFFNVLNLFDKDPPQGYFTAPNSGSSFSGGDPLGRRFEIGVKVQL
jgi:iron complex outermembrane receptor protein